MRVNIQLLHRTLIELDRIESLAIMHHFSSGEQCVTHKHTHTQTGTTTLILSQCLLDSSN